MNEILERTYFQNSIRDYLIALGIIIVGLFLIKTFRRMVMTRVNKFAAHTETRLDDYVIRSIDRFGIPALYILIIYIGLSYLTFYDRAENILRIAFTVAITILVIRFLSSAILALLQSYVKKQSGGEEKVKQLGGLMLLINIFIWLVGLIFLFDNMGYDVTAVIAGLGIGGIAVALAAQNILGDLFNYFVIFFDKPFEIGDFIIIDQKMGVVDYIGIKTTRIKSLSGEQLVFANSDLTSSRIHNYKRMQQRRIIFRIGVIYQTSFDQIKEIPAIIKSIVEEQQPVAFDRAHFASFGDSSLDFEVVYNVLEADFNLYMDIQQTINLKIFEEFENRGIEFAYPTRTLFVSKQEAEEEKDGK